MRHVTPEDLDSLEPLLERLRAIPELHERRRGTFTLRSRGFLHFHEDRGAFYADVRLADAYTRVRVTTATEQTDFLSEVRHAARAAGAGRVAAE